MKENLVRSHVTELGAQADLGEKPKSVQPIRGEVYSARGQTGENPVLKHVDELQWQATLKGEPAPFQPNPAEQQARLGKPPPESEKPGEQRGAAEPSKPNAAERQTPQRQQTQRELRRLAQDPELIRIADELWGEMLTKGEITDRISSALYRYPDLPPNEALREYYLDFAGFIFE